MTPRELIDILRRATPDEIREVQSREEIEGSSWGPSPIGPLIQAYAKADLTFRLVAGDDRS